MVVNQIPPRILVKSVAFPLLAPLPSEAVFLLQDFRLVVNLSLIHI